MSIGQILYLSLVLMAFGGFALIMAWACWYTRNTPKYK